MTTLSDQDICQKFSISPPDWDILKRAGVYADDAGDLVCDGTCGLKESAITAIPSATYKGKVDAAYCENLITISPQAVFESDVYLYESAITEIPAATFKGNVDARWCNHLTTISPQAVFESDVYFHKSGITEIPAATFKGNVNAVGCDQLTTISPQAVFESDVYLYESAITEIPAATFKGNVYAAGCDQLATISPEAVFESDLDVNGSAITAIPSATFKGNVDARWCNHLTTISPQAVFESDVYLERTAITSPIVFPKDTILKAGTFAALKKTGFRPTVLSKVVFGVKTLPDQAIRYYHKRRVIKGLLTRYNKSDVIEFFRALEARGVRKYPEYLTRNSFAAICLIKSKSSFAYAIQSLEEDGKGTIKEIAQIATEGTREDRQYLHRAIRSGFVDNNSNALHDYTVDLKTLKLQVGALDPNPEKITLPVPAGAPERVGDYQVLFFRNEDQMATVSKIQGHCVGLKSFGYPAKVKRGESHIALIHQGNVREGVTVEFDPATGKVIQAQGKGRREPKPEEQQVFRALQKRLYSRGKVRSERNSDWEAGR
jgi:hypothetical protein